MFLLGIWWSQWWGGFLLPSCRSSQMGASWHLLSAFIFSSISVPLQQQLSDHTKDSRDSALGLSHSHVLTFLSSHRIIPVKKNSHSVGQCLSDSCFSQLWMPISHVLESLWFPGLVPFVILFHLLPGKPIFISKCPYQMPSHPACFFISSYLNIHSTLCNSSRGFLTL